LHSSVCKIVEPIEEAIVWYTDRRPIFLSASMIPLSGTDRLGVLDDFVISDKSDSELLCFQFRSNVLYRYDVNLRTPVELVKIDNLVPDQDLICEQYADHVLVVECTYHENYETFSQWLSSLKHWEDDNPFGKGVRLDLRAHSKIFPFRIKKWHAFPDDYDVFRFAESGEGVVFKNVKSRLGQKNPFFGKLNTYYLKKPERASYEDEINVMEGFLVGHHDIVTDPLKIYSGCGVYEVLCQSKTIYKRRYNKKFADFAWYVDRVRTQPDLRLIFSPKYRQFIYSVKDEGGVIDYRTSVYRGANASYMSIIHEGVLRIAYGGPEKLYDIVVFENQHYMLTFEDANYRYAYLISNIV